MKYSFVYSCVVYHILFQVSILSIIFYYLVPINSISLQYQGTSQKIALMKCEECGTCFSERKGTIYYGIKKPDYIFDQVMMLLMMRVATKDVTKLAQTHKHRKNGKVVKVTEAIVFGNEDTIRKILEASSVSNRINTSIVEQMNGTTRAKVSPMVRNSYTFCKKVEMLEAQLTIYFAYYNLIWIHSRLKRTAAWLAGLVNKAYTFRELFELRTPEFICGH